MPRTSRSSRTLRTFLDEQPDPDAVGQSEYRAIHTLLDEIADDPDTTLELADAVLGEVEDWAHCLREDIKRYLTA